MEHLRRLARVASALAVFAAALLYLLALALFNRKGAN